MTLDSARSSSFVTFHPRQRQKADCDNLRHESELRKQHMGNSAEILMFSMINSPDNETVAHFKDLLRGKFHHFVDLLWCFSPVVLN